MSEAPESSGEQSIDEPEEEGRLSRRPFLKTTGAAVVGTALAGCSGGGGGNGGNGGSGGDTTTRATAEGNFEGVEFSFWDTKYFRESRQAKIEIERIVQQFQSDTGATVKLNLQDDEQPLIDAIRKGRQPPAFTDFFQNAAIWEQTGKLLPFEEYQDEFDYDVMGSVGNVTDALSFAYAGWEKDNYILPITVNTFAPFVGRMDFFEQAGLDPDSDFPPKSYDDLVRISKALSKNSDASVGYQIYGSPADIHDVYLNVWTSALGGAAGYELNEDWSEVIIDNDTWKTVFNQIVDLYAKEGQGTKKTPTMSDEEAVNLTIGGQIAMSQQAPMNLPVWMERGGDLFEEGNLRWGQAWPGDTGTNARALIAGGMLTKAPDGVDDATWEKKQDAGLALLKMINNPINQSTSMVNLGFFPARQDVWENISNDSIPGNYVKTVKETTANAKYAYQATGLSLRDVYTPIMQKAVQGDLTADESLDKGKAEAQKMLDDSRWGQ